MAWTVNAKSETEAEILLYDNISKYWGKSAKDFIKDVKDLGNVLSMTVRINSTGGDVWEAQAMYNYLRTHRAHKTVRIDGLAASAASVVAMIGDKIIMPENALMMIHNPWTFALGESSELLKTVEMLDKVRDTIVAVYAAKTGLEYAQLKTMMDEETWMSAEEALSLGFCDETGDPIEIAASAQSLTEGDVTWKTAVGAAQFSRNLAAKMPEAAQKVRLFLTAPRNETKPPAENPQNKIQTKEELELEIRNVAELEAAYPQLVAETRAAAVEAGVNGERERLRALDRLAGEGRDAIIAKAKYEEPKDARDVAIELLQASKNAAAHQDRKDDAAAVNGVLPPANGGPTAKERDEEVEAKMAAAIDKARGYTK